MSYLEKIDFFGYEPRFRIKDSEKLKSKIGGLVTLSYILISIFTIIYTTANFVISVNTVENSMDFSIESRSYLMTWRDIYFGVGIIDSNYNQFNLSDFPYLEIKMRIFNNFNGTNSYQELYLGNCEITKFLSDYDISLLNESTRNEIIKRIKYYFCPIEPFVFTLNKLRFTDVISSLEISLNLKNNSNLTFAKTDLINKNPIFNIIYSDYIVKTNSESIPLAGLIKTEPLLIDFNFAKNAYFIVTPYLISDDCNMLTQGKFEGYIDNTYSSQQDGTFFYINRYSDSFKYYENREYGDNNFRNLHKIIFQINHFSQQTNRVYPKIANLIGNNSALLSNLLVFFMILMIIINNIKGASSIIDTFLKSYQQKKYGNFHKKLKEIISIFNTESSTKINNERNESKFILIKKNECMEGYKGCQRTNQQEQLPEYEKQINSNNNINLNNVSNMMNNQRNILTNAQRNQTTNLKLAVTLAPLFEDKFQFSLIDYVVHKTCCPHKKSKNHILLTNAWNNINKSLDIFSYIKSLQEINFLKYFIFDQYQLDCFNNLSSFICFKRIFQGNENDEGEITDFENDDQINTFSSCLKMINERNNSIDKKVIEFMNFHSS